MAAPSEPTMLIIGSHKWGEDATAQVETLTSDAVTSVTAVISQTQGGAAIETVTTSTKAASYPRMEYWYLSWPTDSIASSPYYITLYATNSDGDGTPAEISTYLYFPPTVSITSPANGTTVTDSSVTLAWTATDDYGISWQRASVSHGGDELWGEEVNGTSIAIPSSVVFEDGESYTFSVTARNGKGMESTATSTVDFSFIAPTAPSLEITEGDGKSASIKVTDSSYSESGTSVEASSSMVTSLTIHGSSVQEGSPSPSAPVAIKSVQGWNLLDDSNIYNLAVSGNSIVSNANYRGCYCRIPTTTGDTKYIISRNVVEGNRFQVWSAATEPVSGTTVTACFTWDNTALTATFTVPAGMSWLFVYLSNNGGTFTQGNIQIVAGTENKVVVPYGSIALNSGDPDGVYTTAPIPAPPLRSLPDGTADELRVEDGNIVMVQRVGVLSVTSATSLTYNVAYGGFRVYLADANINAGNLQTQLRCNALAPNDHRGAVTYVGNDCIKTYTGTTGADAQYIFLCKDGETDAASFKTWAEGVGLTIIYKLATPTTTTLGTVGMPYVDGTVWIDAEVTPEFDATFRPVDFPDQPAADSVDVVRVNADGTSWTLASGSSIGDTVVDALPPLNVETVYKAIGRTTAGGVSEKTYRHVIESDGWVFNFGNAAQEHVALIYNPQVTMSLDQGGESYHFADGGLGGGLPVFYPTTDRDMSGTMKFDTVMYGDADRVIDLCNTYPVAWLRDPYGHRWMARVTPSASHDYGGAWPVSLSWSAVRFKEV